MPGYSRRHNSVVSLCIWLTFVACLIIVPVIRCAAPLREVAVSRTVHIKIVVDPSIATHPDWQRSMTAVFDSAGSIMNAWAHLAFTIDTFAVWESGKAASHDSLFAGDCLVKEVPKGKSDIVVCFDSWGTSPPLIEELLRYEQGYVCLHMPPSGRNAGIDIRAMHAVVHELAHVFGAVHCYNDSNAVTLMNPFVSEGKRFEGDTDREIKFHKGNGLIMTALSQRPFTDAGWDRAMWPPIKKVYDDVSGRFNQSCIDESGELVHYESDAFHEGNLLMYCASWASLCGLPDTALACLDSLAALYRAIKITCIREGIIGKTRLCRVCGYDSSDVSHWLELRLFYLKMRKTMVYLRAGELLQADSCMQEAMKNLPLSLEPVREKYSAGFRFYRERFAAMHLKAAGASSFTVSR
jgi:hypothetical protein